MGRITKHVTVPLIALSVFFFVASLPVEILGCRDRALTVSVIAIAAGLLGIASAVRGVTGKARGEAGSFLWMASALILAIPAIFIVLIAR